MRGNEVSVRGEQADQVGRLFEELVGLLQQGHQLDADQPEPGHRDGRATTSARARCSPTTCCAAPRAARSARRRPARSATSTRSSNNVITFGIGPAGTGKSWLAVAMAVKALQAKQVQRIILTRPAVEAGERLGFLPGDLMAKIDPYLRPLYDALYDMVEPEGAQRLLERQTVEVAPLAFMRGRTLNNSFIILDEAQNTTPEQMKMFLTRIGFGSRVVVTGDVTQVDVPDGKSGLLGLERVAARASTGWRSCSSARPTSCATASSPTSSPPTSATPTPSSAVGMRPSLRVPPSAPNAAIDGRRRRRADRRRRRRRPMAPPRPRRVCRPSVAVAS